MRDYCNCNNGKPISVTEGHRVDTVLRKSMRHNLPDYTNTNCQTLVVVVCLWGSQVVCLPLRDNLVLLTYTVASKCSLQAQKSNWQPEKMPKH